MRSGKGGLPSPTAHSAEHGAVAVAEAEAVEGPLPADHCGRAPGRVPEARPAHPGHTYLSSRSRPALAVGNRSAGGCQTGFTASIFNALPGRPIGALPPAHPTPAALGALATPGVCGSPPVPEGEGMVQGGRRARGEQAPPLSPRLHTRCQKAQLPVWHSSQETGGSRRGPYWGGLRPPRHGHSRGLAPDSLPSLMPTAPFTSLD